MRESKIETHLRVRIHRQGGVSIKMGQEGWPDRLVILPTLLSPSGIAVRVTFVETKSTKGKAKPHQIRRHETLRALGQEVHVPNSKEAIDKIFP